MRKPSSFCLPIGLFGMLLIAGTLPAQSQKADRTLSPANTTVAPAFSAGTFEEIAGTILLRVKLNDTLDTRFLIDSGSWTSFLLPEIATTLNIPLQKVTIGDTELTQGKLAKLALGKALLTDVNFSLDYADQVGSWNKAHPKAPVSGLLGIDTLEKNALGLDFATHTYGLWLGGKIKPQDAENFNSVVCTTQNDSIYFLHPGASVRVGDVTLKNPVMRHSTPQAIKMEKSDDDTVYHALIQLNDVPVSVYLDTGSVGLSVKGSVAAQIKAIPYTSSVVVFGDGMKIVPTTLSYVRKFRMGSFENLLGFVDVIHRKEEEPLDNLLGVNSLSFPNTRIILDFPGHTLYTSAYDPPVEALSGQKALAKLFERGIFFKRKNRDLFFSSNLTELPTSLLIGKDSPAARAGLKNNDELLEVNGKTVAELWKAPDKGQHLLEQSTLRVAIRRKDPFDSADEFERRIFEIPLDPPVALQRTVPIGNK